MRSATTRVPVADGHPDAVAGRPPRLGRTARWTLVGVVLAAAALLLVVLQRLAETHWSPVLDMAMTEMRLRDVISLHPPTVGLVGRIGTLQAPGSHPGPLSFYLLAPIYRLYGSSAWAMEAAGATLNLVAIGAMTWLAARNARAWGAAGAGIASVVLMWYFGPQILATPWNPYLPILWYALFLVALWSVLERDLIALPIAVFSGSVCVQTHISYTLLVVLPGLAVVGSSVWSASRGGDMRRLVRWLTGSSVLGLLLWVPPLAQQALSPHGNLAIIWRHFTDPPTAPIGVVDGASVVLRRFGLDAFLARNTAPVGSVVAGEVLVAVWLVTTIIAFRMRSQSLNRFNLVIGTALVAGIVSAARIFGPVNYYLVLWVVTIGVGLAVSITWCGALALVRIPPGGVRRVLSLAGSVGLATVTIAATAGFVQQARDVVPISGSRSTLLTDLVPSVVAAVRRDERARPQDRHRYLVTWTDPISLGGLGYGMVNELERAGLSVGTPAGFRIAVRDHRVLGPAETTGEVHVAIGASIRDWRGRPAWREIAYADLRTPTQRALSRRLRAEAIRGLRSAGFDDAAALFDRGPFVFAGDPKVPAEARRAIQSYMSLGLPAAAFFRSAAGSA